MAATESLLKAQMAHSILILEGALNTTQIENLMDQGLDLDQDPQDETEMQDHLKQSHTEDSSSTWKMSKTLKVLEKDFMESS